MAPSHRIANANRRNAKGSYSDAWKKPFHIYGNKKNEWKEIDSGLLGVILNQLDGLFEVHISASAAHPPQSL